MPDEIVMTITNEDALRGLRYAVSVKGEDYTYTPPVANQTGCVYVWEVDGELCPQCMVGFALHHLGVPLELMLTSGSNEVHIGLLALDLQGHGYQFAEDSVPIFRAAQIIQDSAMRPQPGDCTCPGCVEGPTDVTWAAALAAAERAAIAFRQPQPPAPQPPTTQDQDTTTGESTGS